MQPKTALKILSLPPTQQVVESPKPSSLTSLTDLHLAVINNKPFKVRSLLYSKEHAIDKRTPTGATPIILAYLYSRHKMFIYLLHKAASIFKHNFQGFTCINYIKHSTSIKPLLKKYKAVAYKKPRLSRRKIINEFLRPFLSIIR